MLQMPAPTSGTNAMSRLFFRFFLCYVITVPIAIVLAMQFTVSIAAQQAGLILFLFLPLALLGALLTITKPYLLLLTVAKAFYDVTLLYSFTLLVRSANGGLLVWNACFLLIVFSLLLFCIAAARAELFPFFYTQRDAKLLFSRPFWRYMLEALFLVSIGLSVYFLWPQIYQAIMLHTSIIR